MDNALILDLLSDVAEKLANWNLCGLPLEDVVQDCCVALLDAKTVPVDPKERCLWVLGVARNSIRKQRRYLARHRSADPDVFRTVEPNHSSSEAAGPQLRLEHSPVWQKLNPKHKRFLVRLAEHRDCNVSVVAEDLGIPRGTGQTIKMRAKA